MKHRANKSTLWLLGKLVASLFTLLVLSSCGSSAQAHTSAAARVPTVATTQVPALPTGTMPAHDTAPTAAEEKKAPRAPNRVLMLPSLKCQRLALKKASAQQERLQAWVGLNFRIAPSMRMPLAWLLESRATRLNKDFLGLPIHRLYAQCATQWLSYLAPLPVNEAKAFTADRLDTDVLAGWVNDTWFIEDDGSVYDLESRQYQFSAPRRHPYQEWVSEWTERKKEGEWDEYEYRSNSGETRLLNSRGLTQTTRANGKLLFSHPNLYTVGLDDEHEEYLFSPKGDRVITASSGGEVRVHHAHTGKTLWTAPIHRTHWIARLTWSKDQNRIAFITTHFVSGKAADEPNQTYAVLMNALSGKVITRIKTTTPRTLLVPGSGSMGFGDITFSGNGTHLIISDAESILRYSAKTGSFLSRTRLPAHLQTGESSTRLFAQPGGSWVVAWGDGSSLIDADGTTVALPERMAFTLYESSFPESDAVTKQLAWRYTPFVVVPNESFLVNEMQIWRAPWVNPIERKSLQPPPKERQCTMGPIALDANLCDLTETLNAEELTLKEEKTGASLCPSAQFKFLAANPFVERVERIDLDGEPPLDLAFGSLCGAKSHNCEFTLLRASDCTVVGTTGGAPSLLPTKSHGMWDLSVYSSMPRVHIRTRLKFDGVVYQAIDEQICRDVAHEEQVCETRRIKRK